MGEEEVGSNPSNATIYYTLDGSDPGGSSTEYSGPIQINISMTVNAIAIESGYLQSDPSSGVYELRPSAPTPSELGGTFNRTTPVVLTSNLSNPSIYYTLDDSDPGDSSTVYTDTINIATTTTIKARVIRNGWSTGLLMDETYVIFFADTARPATFNPVDTMYYSNIINVFLTSPTTPSDIRYTIDGSTPSQTNPNSQSFSSNFPIDNPTIIKAIVYQDGLAPSVISQATYSFRPIAPQISPGNSSSTDSILVTIDAPVLADVFLTYTTDGSDPQDTSLAYTAPFTVLTSQTIIARAFKTGWDPSVADTAVYTITTTPNGVEPPVFFPPQGTYSGPISVSITSPTPATFVYYEINGIATVNSTLLSGNITVSTTQTISAIARTEVSTPSTVVYATYTITAKPK